MKKASNSELSSNKKTPSKLIDGGFIKKNS
jgi:hypothetical protein